MTPAEALDFRTLHDEYLPYVRHIARRFGVTDAAVDDVCQDTFLTVFRCLPPLEEAAALKVWLYKATRNIVLTHQRTQRRKCVFRGASAEGDDLDTLVSAEPGPFEKVQNTELLQHARRAIDKVDANSREAFVQMDVLGMSAPEIAEKDSVKICTLYARVRRARQQLAQAGRQLGV